MSDEEDPEVIADLQLRAASEFDRTRTRGANYAWRKPPDAATWMCRNPQCRAPVGVPEEAVHALDVHSRRLASLDEKLIDVGEIVMCDACRAVFQSFVEKRQAQIRESMADLIRQFKNGETSFQVKRKDGVYQVNEREALEQLERWGHPDVKGFAQHFQAKRESGKAKKERRGAM